MAIEILVVRAAALGLQVNVTNSASTAANLPSRGGAVRVVNEGSVNAYVAISTDASAAVLPSTSVAQRTSCIILAGTDSVFRIGSDEWHQISAITRSGATTLQIYVSEGE